MCQAAGLNWAGDCGRDSVRVPSVRVTLGTNGGLLPSQGAPGRMGAQGEPGLAGYDVRSSDLPTFWNSALQAWTQAPSAAAPTSSQPRATQIHGLPRAQDHLGPQTSSGPDRARVNRQRAPLNPWPRSVLLPRGGCCTHLVSELCNCSLWKWWVGTNFCILIWQPPHPLEAAKPNTC